MKNKSLAESYPQIAEQWHPTKNGNISPDDVTPGSSERIWWICPTNHTHEWATRVIHRTKGRGCPYCAGKRKLGYTYRTLSEAFPEIAAEWHAWKNGDLTPSDLTEGSGEKVWWQCRNNPSHIWQAKVYNRTAGIGKCPKCSGRLISKTTSLAARYPSIAKQWHQTKNGDLTPDNVFPSSKKRVWWQCNVNPKHEWQAKISSRIQTSGECKYCVNKKRVRLPVLAEYDPELAKEWHVKKNKGLTANDVTAGSPKKVWWQCKNDPEHVWQAAIGNRTRGRGCPVCSGKVAGNRNLALLYPNIAKEWHPTKNDNLKPEDVIPGSQRRVWWRCSVDQKHEWEAFIFLRAKRGTGKCPKCTGLEKKSFDEIYPDVAKEWHPTKNGKLKAADIPPSSRKKYWWQCSVNPKHVWNATPQNRGINKSSCPFCYKDRAGKELLRNLTDSIISNSQYFKTFTEGIESINSLLAEDIKKIQSKSTFYKMLYAQSITIMEAYLSDAFINTVINDAELIKTLLTTVQPFSSEKIRLSEVPSWTDNIKKPITERLSEISYHNLPKVEKMYNNVLDVTFPEKLDDVYKAISIRHDIIHRNGKTKDGELVKIFKKDVKKILKNIIVFIFFVERQLNNQSS